MAGDARFMVELQPRYRELQAHRWPVTVAPKADELLSSWLHRLALANGVAPRHFGDVLGAGAGMWSARLDLALPDGTCDFLYRQTGVARDRIAMMTLGSDPDVQLLLPLRQVIGRRASTWLQFCPQCLAADEAPYFRRRWRWATRISCWVHGCGLRDRCSGCGGGIAAFAQRDLSAQHFCQHCGHDLRIAARVAATRRKARLMDDLCRLEAARGFTATSSLTQRLLHLPRTISPVIAHTLTQLSVAARIRCIDRIDDGLTELRHDEVAVIAFWRNRIVRAGGVAKTLEPLCESLSRGLAQREGRRKTQHTRLHAGRIDLQTLKRDYTAVLARRQRRLAM